MSVDSFFSSSHTCRREVESARAGGIPRHAKPKNVETVVDALLSQNRHFSAVIFFVLDARSNIFVVALKTNLH